MASRRDDGPRPRRALAGSARPPTASAVTAWVRKTYHSKPHGYWQKTYAELFEAGTRSAMAPELREERIAAHALLADFRASSLATADLRVLEVAERMVHHLGHGQSLTPVIAAERDLGDAVRVAAGAHELDTDADGGYTNAVLVTRVERRRHGGEPCAVARHLVCAANDDAYRRAREVAAELRETRGPDVRAMLAYTFPDEPWGTLDLETALDPSAPPYFASELLSATSDAAMVRRFVAAKGTYPVVTYCGDLAAALAPEDAVPILAHALAALLVKPKGQPLMKTPPRDIVAALVTIDSPLVAELLEPYAANPVIGVMVRAHLHDRPKKLGTANAPPSDSMSDVERAEPNDVPAVLRDRPWRATTGAKKKARPTVLALAVLGLENERVVLPDVVELMPFQGRVPVQPMTASELADWRKKVESPGAHTHCDYEHVIVNQTWEYRAIPDEDGLSAWNEHGSHAAAGLVAWVAKHGVLTIPGFVRRDWLRWLDYEGASDVIAALTSLVSPRIAPLIATVAARRKKHRRRAIAWLRDHVEIAALGLVPVALADDAHARADAEDALAFLARDGHQRTVREVASRYGADALAAIDALLSRDPLSLGVKPPKQPDFLREAELPPLRSRSGGVLPDDARAALVEMLQVAPDDPPYVGFERVRDACDDVALAAIAFGLLEQWILGDAPGRAEWMLAAVARFPSAAAERRVAAIARDWARNDGAKASRACRALAALGTNLTLMHLAHVAETSRFDTLRKEAMTLLAEAAETRGLSATELADRTVPDAGLDADGTITLSYGVRSFRVTLDESLRPAVREQIPDASEPSLGPRQKTLPRPNKHDDAQAAKAARVRFDALKDDLEAVAKRQIRRFEQAMVTGRTWSVADFRARIVGHPLTIHLATRVVWEQITPTGLVSSFRLVEDRTLADEHDEETHLPVDAIVRIAHPARTTTLRASWATLFTDYQILEPFEQLARATFAMTDDERSATELARTVAGPNLSAKRILGTLESRGWEREHGGFISAYRRDVQSADGSTLVARLPLSPGISIESLSYDAGQSIGALHVERDRARVPIGELDDVSFSELLRDATSVR